MTACQAANLMGISRKTYYKWEQRGLDALLGSLDDQHPGRAAQPADNWQQMLEKAHRDNTLFRYKIAIQDVLTELKLQTGCDRAKKNERIEQALAMIAEVKKRYSLSDSEIARQLGLSYATLMRWRRWLIDGQPPVEKLGPKKIKPLNLGQLRQKIRDLEHVARRSHGTARLHDAFNESISRRELDQMILSVRNESNRLRAAGRCHITWLRPNLA